MATEPRSSGPGNTPLAIDYERGGAEPIDGAFRDGNALVLPRGADISKLCIRCARPAAGKPILLRLTLPEDNPTPPLSGSTGIGFLLYFVWIIFVGRAEANRRSEGRTVTVGLCAQHRRRQRRFRWGVWASLLVGAGMCGAGIADLCGKLDALGDYGGSMTFMGVVVTLFGVGFFLTKARPAKLSKEIGGWLWLEGAGDAIVSAQPPLKQG